MPSPGRPKVMIRFHPEALRMLRERVKLERGRKSGVAGYIRELVYQHLGFTSLEWPPGEGDSPPD